VCVEEDEEQDEQLFVRGSGTHRANLRASEPSGIVNY